MINYIIIGAGICSALNVFVLAVVFWAAHQFKEDKTELNKENEALTKKAEQNAKYFHQAVEENIALRDEIAELRFKISELLRCPKNRSQPKTEKSI